MAVTRYALFALVALSICYGITSATAQEPPAPEAENLPVRDSLAEQLFVPKAGRIEVACSQDFHVEMELEDLDDVMALHKVLHEALDQGEFNEDAIYSMKFLERAGIRPMPRGQLYIIEGDRRVPVVDTEITQWRAKTIQFKPGYYAESQIVTGTPLRLVHGPRSVVRTSQWMGNVSQVRHESSGGISTKRRQRQDPWRLFSRDADHLTQAGLKEDLAQGQLYEIKHGAREILWLDRETDAIYARISSGIEKPIQNFHLLLGTQKFDEPTPHHLPRLTLSFQRMPNYWTVRGYEIRQTDFSKVPPAATFQVTLPKEVTYLTPNGTRFPDRNIPDIVPFTPGEIVGMMRRR